MKCAVVTLAIGTEFLSRWHAVCADGWRAYCRQHGYDLLVIDKPIDCSERAAGRSPGWQKCLVLQPAVAGPYDRIVWVDADIIINPAAPAIDVDVPIEKIGAIDEHAFPSAELRQRIIRSLADRNRKQNPDLAKKWEAFLDPAGWHALAGLPRRGRHIFQTGVMVLSPRRHRGLLEHVYYSYEDHGGYEMNYEMRYLSFEVQEHDLQHWIDPRFNALILFLQKQIEMDRGGKHLNGQEQAQLLQQEYARNYFLHFAGFPDLMRLAFQIRLGLNPA